MAYAASALRGHAAIHPLSLLRPQRLGFLRPVSSFAKRLPVERPESFDHGFEEHEGEVEEEVVTIKRKTSRLPLVSRVVEKNGPGHLLLEDASKSAFAISSSSSTSAPIQIEGNARLNGRESRLSLSTKDAITLRQDQGVDAIAHSGEILPSHAMPGPDQPVALTASPDSSHLSSSSRRIMVARRQADELARRPEVLSMHPDRLSVQQDLVQAKSAARVLAICSPAEVAAMDTVNLATAIHRIARLVGPSRSLVVTNPHFIELAEAIQGRISDLSSHSLVSVLWAIARLEFSPQWLDDLLLHCVQQSRNFTVKDLSVALSCLAKAPSLHASPLAEQLKGELLKAAQSRISEFVMPMDVVCLAAGLSRLGLRDEQMFARIAERSVTLLDSFNMSDIASLTWAFANMNFLHGELFRQVRGILQQQVESCSPRELVQISWAFSKVKKADEELMLVFFAPAVRAKMLEFDAPRDLCTLVWTFSHAGVFDAELFNDLAHTLIPKVKLMNAHDVSSLVVAYSSIEYAHQKLFRALQKHTRKIVHSFSPLQLARTIYGFGASGIDDEPLFRLLCEHVLKNRHLLHAKNVVEIIVGLSEAEYMPHKVLQPLLGDLTKVLRWIEAQDAIQLLHALSKLPRERLDDSGFSQAVAKLLSLVRKRSQGWWRFRPQDMADLLEAIQVWGHVDSLLLDTVCKQLPRTLRLLADDYKLFLRLLGGFAELSGDSRTVVRSWLHRGRQLQVLFEERLVDALLELDGEPRNGILLAYACARLGYEGPAVLDLVDSLCEAVRENQEALPLPWLSLFMWTLTEMGREEELARDCALHFLECTKDAIVDDDMSFGSLLRVAWTCVALRMNLSPSLLLETVRLADDDIKSLSSDNLQMAKVIALELARQKSENAATTQPEILSWWNSVLTLSTKEESGQAFKHKPSIPRTYELPLSSALVRNKIPHECAYWFRNVYRLPLAIPQHQVVVDVLGPGDMMVPSSQLTGSASLRMRQIEEGGWAYHSLALHAIQKAESDADVDSLFDPIFKAVLPTT